MRRHDYRRLGLGTIVTALIMLSVVAILGTSALIMSNQNFMLFKTIVNEPYSTMTSKNLESVVIENSVYHSLTRQLNFTFTNTGNTAINITNIQIYSPTLNITGVTSASETNAESVTSIPIFSKPIYSKTNTETISIPGSTIRPGQTFTSGVLDPCLTDPVTISAKTSRGSVITTQVTPNVGWYDDHWKFRKRITLNYTQIIGNPTPIQLDNVKNSTFTTVSYYLPNFVVGSGSNRLLLVNIESSLSTATVQSLNYSGMSLTRANGTTNTVDSEIWYLVNPPAGTANIGVKMTNPANVEIGAYSFFGVDQTYPISFSAYRTGSGTSGFVRANTTSINSWVVDSIAVPTGNALIQNIGQALEWNYTKNGLHGGSSYALTPLPTTQTMGWNWSGSQNYASVAVEIKSSAFYNFPLLVNETTDTDLKNYAKSNRYDVLFTACDGTTKLDHEIENYTTTTGSLTAWVQVPNIYNSPNNVIYMYYNNTAATNQQNIVSTWDPTFSAVYHFANSPSATGTPPVIDNFQQALVNVTGQPGGPIANTITLSNFVVGGFNSRVLVVGAATDTPDQFLSITYGGTPLIQLPAHQLTNTDSELWYLVNPPIGTANIVGTLVNGHTNVMTLSAYSIHGVDQTTPIAPLSTVSTGIGSPASVKVTNIYPNSLLIDEVSVGYGAQAGCCMFTHAPWDLESPLQTQHGLNPIDINRVTSATSSSLPALPCTTTTFQWTVHYTGGASNTKQWTDAAVEVKSNSSSGDTTVQDSTVNQNYLAPANLPTCGQSVGKIGGGASLNTGAQQGQFFVINSTLTGMPSLQGPKTISLWYNAAAPAAKEDFSSLQQDVLPYPSASTSTALRTGFQTTTSIDAWKFLPAGTTNILTKTPVPLANNWHYVVYTYNRTTNILYIDGVRQTSSSTVPPSGWPNSLYIGASTSTNNANTLAEFFKGTMDEFRYSNTARSASWIATEYNNQLSPSTFITIGPPEKVTDIR